MVFQICPKRSIKIPNGLKNEKKLNGSKKHLFLWDSICLIRNVLVAVDGSENSDRALDFGLDLVEKFRAIVTVLNASESPTMGVVPLEPTNVSGESKGGVC
jgi:hypothetical protein